MIFPDFSIKPITFGNTPGTWGGPGGHDRTLALHISSSYAKILGETNFQPREIPRSGSKAKDGKERPKVGKNNGQLRIAIAEDVKEREREEQKSMITMVCTFA